MTRNLLRLASLVFVFATALGLTLPRPALAFYASCGTGDYFVSCTKKCCGNGVTTTYSLQGVGGSCSLAQGACSSCVACPAGQSPCGTTYGACAT